MTFVETIRPRSAVLRPYWHPVAYARDVGKSPYGARLLTEPLVLWRDSRGTAQAFYDLCIHRGTALSLGTVNGDEIVCPYHGWRYRGDGVCTAIPQLKDSTRVPAKARATAFRCVERYGLIWVAVEEPRWPLPDIPEMETAGWRTVLTGPFAWACESSRQVENFTDLGHFPFVHPGLLGDPSRPVVIPPDVREEGHVLHYEFLRPEAPSTAEFPIFPNWGRERPERQTRYEFHLPYTITVRMNWGGDETLVYLFSSQPVAEDRCIGYCLVTRNYNLDQEDSVLQRFEDVIFNQDKRVVESQRPEQVPFDLSDELHLRFDAVAVGYRRRMRAEGLA